MISIFCDNHALGVVNYLSLSIESSTASLVEKRRAVRAIELLVLTVAADATVALPQVCHLPVSIIEMGANVYRFEPAYSHLLTILNYAMLLFRHGRLSSQ